MIKLLYSGKFNTERIAEKVNQGDMKGVEAVMFFGKNSIFSEQVSLVEEWTLAITERDGTW